MTIQVIKHGTKPSDKTYAATCHSCHAELAWKKSDATRVWEGDQRDGPFTQISCPDCGTTVTGY